MTTANYVSRAVRFVQEHVIGSAAWEAGGWWEGGMDPSGIILRSRSLLVIVSMNPWVGRDGDEQSWLHVSISRAGGPRQMPSWEQLVSVKELVIGDDREALQVIPARSEHYSIAEVAHLWHRLDSEPVLPNFTKGGTL